MKGSPVKGTTVSWEEKEKTAFQELKTALTSEPVLRHQIGKPFTIDLDSSQYTIRAVLQQFFPDPKTGKDRLHPIAYESKKLTETESRYPTQEQELLAAKYALDHWRHIIEGSEIIIRTDHQSLQTYRTKKHMTPRLIWFMQDIEHYNRSSHTDMASCKQSQIHCLACLTERGRRTHRYRMLLFDARLPHSGRQ